MRTELEKEIEHLKRVIAQGDKFEEQGYDCSYMNEINRSLLRKLEAKARDAT